MLIPHPRLCRVAMYIPGSRKKLSQGDYGKFSHKEKMWWNKWTQKLKTFLFFFQQQIKTLVFSPKAWHKQNTVFFIWHLTNVTGINTRCWDRKKTFSLSPYKPTSAGTMTDTHIKPQRAAVVSTTSFLCDTALHSFWNDDGVMVQSIINLSHGPQLYHSIVLVKKVIYINECMFRTHNTQVWRLNFILE